MFSENNQSIITGIVILFVVIFFGVLFFSTRENTVQPVKENINVSSQSQPLQIKTFPVDEMNQPLNEQNAAEAITRNEARIDLILDDLDEDNQSLTDLENSL